jgi:hypothetical protein
MLTLLVTKIVLVTTITFGAAPTPGLDQTVETDTILAGLDRATATLTASEGAQ